MTQECVCSVLPLGEGCCNPRLPTHGPPASRAQGRLPHMHLPRVSRGLNLVAASGNPIGGGQSRGPFSGHAEGQQHGSPMDPTRLSAEAQGRLCCGSSLCVESGAQREAQWAESAGTRCCLPVPTPHGLVAAPILVTEPAVVWLVCVCVHVCACVREFPKAGGKRN